MDSQYKSAYHPRCKYEGGNVLFLVLLAVVLFAALNYAVTNAMRGDGKNASTEKAQLDQAVLDNFTGMLETGRQRLTAKGCTNIDYTPPASQSSTGDKSCFMFHPDGAGVIYQDLGLDECSMSGGTPLEDLAIGESCGGLIYAGSSSGSRLYTTSANLGSFAWGPNGATGTSGSNGGLVNTNILVGLGSSYAAAYNCRLLGEKWFLPSSNEYSVLWTNSGTGELNGTFPTDKNYWTSQQVGSNSTAVQFLFTNNTIQQNTRSAVLYARCVRSD